ncbi:MAG: winged helix-turn-helix domain-containing protein [Glaciecola sp.]
MRYEFGQFSLCTQSEKLRDNQQNIIKIEHQQLALLLLFLESPNQLVNRHDIVERVWLGRETSDEAIRVALKKLRDILSDNPKSPDFIKTVPKQGYKWIAEVTHAKSPIQWWQKHKLALLCTAGVCLCAWFIWLPFQRTTTTLPNTSIVALTNMAGSEVVADYHHKQNKLAFLHRANRGEPQQLYVKYLNTNEVVRLSWDEQNYSNVHWSPNGNQLAFTQYASSGKILNIARFDTAQNLQTIEAYTNKRLANKSVSDWTSDGKSLLLVEEFTPNSTHSIYQYTLENQKLRPISFPNTSGRGDYLAKQSETGKYTAILRESEPNKISLVIIDATNGDAIAQHALDFTPSYMLWSEDSSQVSLTSFFGEHMRFDVKNKVVSYSPELPANILDGFSHCGDRCYVLRQHNGNFLDIQEKPLASLFSTDKTQSIIGAGRLFKEDGAQDFPIYMPRTNGVIFASLHNGSLSIKSIGEDGHHAITSLDKTYQLSGLSISPNGKYISGSIKNRLFVSTIEQRDKSQLTFVTDALEQASNPVWSKDSKTILYASVINKIPTILSLNPTTLDKHEVLRNAVAFSHLQENQGLALVIKPNLDAMVYEASTNDTQPTWLEKHKIVSLQSANVNRWKIVDEYLYFTRYENYEAQLCRASWKNAQEELTCVSIGKNRFRLHFDVDSSKQRILLVESLSAESNIIKMVW